MVTLALKENFGTLYNIKYYFKRFFPKQINNL